MKKIVFFVVVFVFLPSVLWANNNEGKTSSFQQFQQEVNQAYTSYRVALFQTNKKNQARSLESAVDFQQQWLAITDKYIEAPPEVYASDPQWEDTLLKIGDIAGMGILEMLDGKLSDAHETLEAIRDELGALRQRNQVSTFSDHVNNYHEAMESLLHLGLKPDDIDSKAMLSIREELAVLEYLAKKMQENAPADYLENQKFHKAMEGIFESLKNLRQAVNGENPDKVAKVIKALKPAYAKVFIKFG
ncbi:MAG: hypothetical protein JSW69_00380 [Deltaproteobacteria bacterium]|nr:MAG: hypothetical protein JSW69_00380 [Deltaproteobacteria bacterium]